MIDKLYMTKAVLLELFTITTAKNKHTITTEVFFDSTSISISNVFGRNRYERS